MIIVTGGAGFIGSNLVRGLNARGITNILIVDDLTEGDKHRNLNSLGFGDFVDYRDFIDHLDSFGDARVDAIFHQGACSDTMEHDGRYMMRVNYEFSKRLLSLAEGRCPFLYASSASVYGSGERGFREEPACEYPLNVYAFSKYLFDRHVRRALSRINTQVVGLRYFNVFGPQEAHKGRMASVVNKFHHTITAGRRLEIFEGSADFRRDFVFVDDIVDMNLFFFENPGKSGIFNAGTGKAESFMDLAREVAGQYENAEIVEIPFPEELHGKYQTFTCADLSLLHGAGYEKEPTSLAEGVSRYVKVLRASDGYYQEPIV